MDTHLPNTSISMSTDVPEYHYLEQLFKDIREYASENIEYFSEKEKKDFIQSFQTILNVIEPMQIAVEVVSDCCDKFDVHDNCKGNGFRSVINIVKSCLQKILLSCQQTQKSRDKLFFRSYHMYMELESYTQVLSRLLTICNLAVVLLDNSKVGNLFPENGVVDDMIADFEKINRECFYGRTFCFQYCDSIRQAMQVVGVTMAAYGDGYNKHNHPFTRALSSVLHSGKYMVNPELRAKRITELTQNANIDFCKAFWSLTEEYGVQHAPLLLCPAMAVNIDFDIPNKPIQVKTLNDNIIDLEFPTLHSKEGVIKCRLLSYAWREGQKNRTTTENGISSLGPKPAPKSRYLMIHCHGGGFVSQSSKSHEIYLRSWAKELQIPILSIDYSLSPDAPYPQALNEIYFAYAWALNNLDKLGSTGEKIVFSGDSAGANLVTAITLKAIQDNIRLPDSIVVAYPPYRLQFLPSPSRMLCLMDPLLPLGVLKSCIQAYTGCYRRENPKQISDSLSHDGELYNAFDLDFGHDHSRRTKFDAIHSGHSYSETQLNITKEKFNTKPFEEDASFCSEFPYSETESSCCSDDETQFLRDHHETDPSTNDYNINRSGDVALNKQNKSKISPSSVLSNLTSQVTSTVHGLTSGVTDYFYGGEQNKQPDRIRKQINHVTHQDQNSKEVATTQEIDQTSSEDETHTVNCSTRISPHVTRKRSLETTQEPLQQQQNNTPTENKISVELNIHEPCTTPKSRFSLCKVCLNKTENCTCGEVNSPKVLRKRGEKYHKSHKHYKSSHHHITHVHTTNRPRSTSFTNDIDVWNRQGSMTLCDADRDNNHSSTPCSPLTKNKRLSGLQLSLLSHHQENVLREKHLSNTNLHHQSSTSPRVLYDKSAEMCMILPPEEETEGGCDKGEYEMVDTPIMDADENQLYGTSSEVFQCAKDPFMSPYLADDELLKQLPPISIVACTLDPLLDDSVEFVKKLHQVNNTAELYVLDKLPHGFLNFRPFSSEAQEGSDLLIACIKKSLQMGMRRVDSTASFSFKKK